MGVPECILGDMLRALAKLVSRCDAPFSLSVYLTVEFWEEVLLSMGVCVFVWCTYARACAGTGAYGRGCA